MVLKMNTENYESYWEGCSSIEQIPGKVSGTWIFKGTRVPLYSLHDNMASGESISDFMENFPSVTMEQIQDVLRHEARRLENDRIITDRKVDAKPVREVCLR